MTRKKISIVVSVYNEEEVLSNFFDEFDKLKKNLLWDYEVIFVDDGSIDNSLNLLQYYVKTDHNIKVISFSRNFGHEAAMIAGIDNAIGDGIICMDADLQHPINYIHAIIKKLEEDYDVINMVRLENKSAGWVKNITSKLFYKVINILSDQVSFEENASDFFAISGRVAEVIRKSYREKIRFLRGYIQSVGYNKTTINYIAANRVAGSSHYNIKKLIEFSMSTIVCFSNFPLKLGIYAGLISAMFGLTVLIYSLFKFNNAPSGYTTLVILNSFMFAVLFIVIGIIGQYIAVLFSEIKDRPIYIIERKLNFKEN